MLKKNHSSTSTRIKNNSTETDMTNNLASGRGNRVEMSLPSIYFFGALLLVMTFVSGYFYGKISAGGNIQNTNTNAAVQPTQGQQQAQQQPTQKTNVTIDQLRGLFGNGNITFGDKNSKLIFVEISDPSCPYCSAASGENAALNKQMGTQFILKADGGSYVAPVPEMKKLVDSGKAAMVWLYSNGHGSGELATQALYCANEKGKFWAVQSLLMNADGYALLNGTVKNDKTQSGTLANYLKSAVDSNFMKSCLEGGKYADRLTKDSTTARTLGFNGTPDFFVNTTNFEGAYSWTDMQPAVDAALNK